MLLPLKTQRLKTSFRAGQFLFCGSLILGLSACSPASKSNPIPLTDSGQASSGITLPDNLNETNSGRVIDGYIEGAYVCLDSNENYICEANEKTQRSNQQGRYANSNFLDSSSNSTLIAQVVAGLSKDQDDAGATISTGYVMLALDNQPNLITPFTTLLNYWQRSGLTLDEAKQALAQALSLPLEIFSQDYISANNNKAHTAAKIIVLTLQALIAEELLSASDPSSVQASIQASVWQRFTIDILTGLNSIIEDPSNSDKSNNELSQAWLNVYFLNPTIPDPTVPTIPDPTIPTIPDPTIPDSGNNLSVFNKINGLGTILDSSSTDYQCVSQTTDAQGNAIIGKDQRTWMLLIPADATYASLNISADVIPAGFNRDDKFWDYTWSPEEDITLQPHFKESNGLIRQYAADDNVEQLLYLLNTINYCGFSDWTVPTIASLKTLNTQPLLNNSTNTSTSTVLTIDKSIFKFYQAHLDQLAQRASANGGDVDESLYPYLIEPYFWSANRSLDNNSIAKTGINDFVKYQHPSDHLTTAENSNGGKLLDENVNAQGSITGGQYHALRAVRYPRYSRINSSGQQIDLTSDWHCILDTGPIENRFSKNTYWTRLISADSNLLKQEANTNIANAISANRCGFNDWRLPSAAEIINLKAMNSNSYFSGFSDLDSNSDYVWLDNPATADDTIPLWRHSDMLVGSSNVTDFPAQNIMISYGGSSIVLPEISVCDGGNKSAEINNQCYTRHDTEMTWQDARDFCTNINTSLASKANALADISDLASGLNLVTSSFHWLADESGTDKAISLFYSTYYQGGSAQSKTTSFPFICVRDLDSSVDTLPPVAPTLISEDDINNTFAWNTVSGFDAISDYEFSLNNGASWQIATANPITVGDIAITLGHLQVRIKATSNQQAGRILKSTIAFTSTLASDCSTENSLIISNQCFTLYTVKLQWSAAQNFCTGNNGALTSFEIFSDHSEKLSSGLGLVSDKSYWLLDEGADTSNAQILYFNAWLNPNWRAQDNLKSNSFYFICVNNVSP